MQPTGPVPVSVASPKREALSPHVPMAHGATALAMRCLALALVVAFSTAISLGQGFPPLAGLQPGDQYRILLVTDAGRDATSANIQDYDAFVTADANAVAALAALQTNWRAVASTQTVHARDHTGTAGGGGVPIYRPDGVRVFNDYTDMWSGSRLLAPPHVTSSGLVAGPDRVWTGTYLDGTAFEPLGVPGSIARAGDPHATNYAWVRANGIPAATLQAFYGISDVLTVPLDNFDCGSAVAVGLGSHGPYSTIGAPSSSVPWGACAPGGSDLWFRYTADCTAPHTFDTCGSDFDTVLEVFGGSCGTLISLGCDDDSGRCGDLRQSSLTVSLQSGGTYYVRVGGYSGAQGNAMLDIERGTGTGSITTAHTSTCADTLTIDVAGNPNIGGTVTMTVGGNSGLPFYGIGFPPINTGLLDPAPCGAGCHVIGPAPGIGDFEIGTLRSLALPCLPFLIGVNVDLQALDVLPANPSCVYTGVPINLSDIVTVTIG